MRYRLSGLSSFGLKAYVTELSNRLPRVWGSLTFYRYRS